VRGAPATRLDMDVMLEALTNVIRYRVWFVGDGKLPARHYAFRDEPLTVDEVTVYGAEPWTVEEIIEAETEAHEPVVVLRRVRPHTEYGWTCGA